MITAAARVLRIIPFLSLLGGHLFAQRVAPVLDFPDHRLDDPQAYRGYITRFYRDGNGNTVQVALDHSAGRIVHVWANNANESIAFSARKSDGHPEVLTWETSWATRDSASGMQLLNYALRSRSSRISLGFFLLGSMRREREFQYAGGHGRAFDAKQGLVPGEILEFLDLLSKVPSVRRDQILQRLRAASVEELRERTRPVFSLTNNASIAVVDVRQPSFDGKNQLLLRLTLEGTVSMDSTGQILHLHSMRSSPMVVHITIGTDSAPLRPLGREALLTEEFLDFLKLSGPGNPRLERQVVSLELMSSREKLMAGLPNFATYFGRDMIMTMLMLEPVLLPSVQENAITTILRKLSPRGEVSHEEALGGQAIRENVAVANRLIRQAIAPIHRDSMKNLFARVEEVVSDLQRTREDYRMLDDDFQLPVLVARYMARQDVAKDSKLSFLQQRIRTGRILDLLLRNFEYVADRSAAYALDPRPANLIDFPQRAPGRFFSGSWRDSDAGYANGRYAMDINAIWVPLALEAVRTILSSLESLGIGRDSLATLLTGNEDSNLRRYVRDPRLLEAAIQSWNGAANHFVVALKRLEIETRAKTWLQWLPSDERKHWRKSFQKIGIPDELRFLAISLDSLGVPIPVPNTDGAMLLFMGDLLNPDLLDAVLAPVITPYPVGLLAPRIGPLAANDTYASKNVRAEFRNDRYHSPSVVWGREVNLLLFGIRKQLSSANKHPSLRLRLEMAWREISEAVRASGLSHNELWTYRIEDGHLVPTRYPTGSDIQAWNVTDLGLQFLLWKEKTSH